MCLQLLEKTKHQLDIIFGTMMKMIQELIEKYVIMSLYIKIPIVK